MRSGGRPEHRLDCADEWFWPHVDMTCDDCWPWSGPLDRGYGRIWVQGRKQRVHRVAFRLVTGLWPVDYACHRCGTRNCCRVSPDHVYDGTALQNTADRILSGVSTGSAGTRNGNARLTDAAVMQIKRDLRRGRTGADLAREHGVTPALVSQIKSGRAWVHLASSEE